MGGRNLRGRDFATVLLLLLGGFLAGIGWFVGTYLLWTSTSWTSRDKLIGTFVWPGGLSLSLLLLGLGTQTCASNGNGSTVCTGTTLSPWLAPIVAVLLLLGPILTYFYLVRAADRPIVAAH